MKIDLTIGVSLFISVTLSLVITFWMFYNYFSENEERDIFEDSRFVEQCPYCTCIYFDYKEGGITVCPRCGSYGSVKGEGDVQESASE